MMPLTVTAALATVRVEHDPTSHAIGTLLLVLSQLRGGASPAPAPLGVAISSSPATTAAHRSSLSDRYHQISTQFYNHWPEPLRFFVSGNLGNVIFFSLERLIHSLLHHHQSQLPPLVVQYIDAVSFMMGYFLHIVAQHWLHAFLVYGMHTIDTSEKYLKTLIGCYSTYMSAMFGSTILNTTLIQWGCHRTLAFMITLWTFACMNFMILKSIHSNSSSTNCSGIEELSASSSLSSVNTATTTNASLSSKSKTSPTTGSRRGINQSTLSTETILPPIQGGAFSTMTSTSRRLMEGTSRRTHAFVRSVGEPVKLHDC